MYNFSDSESFHSATSSSKLLDLNTKLQKMDIQDNHFLSNPNQQKRQIKPNQNSANKNWSSSSLYESFPSIQYEKFNQQINQLLKSSYTFRNQQQSDFRRHVIFEALPIQREDQQDFIRQLMRLISRTNGEIKIIQKLKNSRQYLYYDCQTGIISISIGFKYDIHALLFLKKNQRQFKMNFKGKQIVLKPVVSPAFKYYQQEALLIESQKLQQGEVMQLEQPIIRQQIRQQQSTTLNKYGQMQIIYESKNKFKEQVKQQTNLIERRTQVIRQNENNNCSQNQDRSSSRNKQTSNIQVQIQININQEKTDEVKLKIFGIRKNVGSKDVIMSLQNYIGNCFQYYSNEWKSIENAEYLEISVNKKSAEILLHNIIAFEICKLPILVLICGPSQEQIKNKLREHQIMIQFPKSIHPLNVYNTFIKFGKIIQLVLQSDQNKKYYITFQESLTAETIKDIKVETKGILINYLNDGQLVYRPTKSTILRNLV